MKKKEWITAEELKISFDVELVEIWQAITEKRLPCYSPRGEKMDREFVFPTQDEVRIQETLYGEPGIGYIAVADCFFKIADVLTLWDDNQNVDTNDDLSAYAMLKQPVFKETLAAMKELLIYCENNKPGKKDDAYAIYCKKHPKLTERVFKALWKTIPQSMRRSTGETDKNLNR